MALSGPPRCSSTSGCTRPARRRSRRSARSTEPSSAQSEKDPNHLLLSVELLQRRKGIARSGALRDLLTEITASRWSRVLVSGEELSMPCRRPDLLEGLKSAFEGIGGEVHVLVCCRPADSCIPGLYGTLVRQGMGIERQEFERQARLTGRVVVPATSGWPKRIFCTDPDELVRGFRVVFAEDRLHVVDYTPSGMVTRLVGSQGWFFGGEASLFGDVHRENVSGDAEGRRRLEDLLAEAQGSMVWRSTAWVRNPTAQKIRGRVGGAMERLLRRSSG